MYAASVSDHISGYTFLYGFRSSVDYKNRLIIVLSGLKYCRGVRNSNVTWWVPTVHTHLNLPQSHHFSIMRSICSMWMFYTLFPIHYILNEMCVYPPEAPVIVDPWVGRRSWPTLSSVGFESPPHLHHRSRHRKELASPPAHWPPPHKINTRYTNRKHMSTKKDIYGNYGSKQTWKKLINKCRY